MGSNSNIRTELITCSCRTSSIARGRSLAGRPPRQPLHTSFVVVFDKHADVRKLTRRVTKVCPRSRDVQCHCVVASEHVKLVTGRGSISGVESEVENETTYTRACEVANHSVRNQNWTLNTVQLLCVIKYLVRHEHEDTHMQMVDVTTKNQ